MLIGLSFLLMTSVDLRCLDAQASSVVTLCSFDDESGNGINLAQALASSAIEAVNNISFSCGVGPKILVMRQTHQISRTTAIDGAGVITLDGDHLSGPMFTANDRQVGLFLNGLTIINSANVISGTVGAVLNHSTIDELLAHVPGSAISLQGGTLGLFDSHLRGTTNGSSPVGSAPLVDARLESLTFDHAEIRNPHGPSIHVLAGGGEVNINSSEFSGNQSGFIDDCVLSINDSTFHDHKAPTMKGGVFEIGCNTTISHSAFTNNVAGAGGALYFLGKVQNVSLTAVEFTGNQAKNHGGAVVFQRGVGIRTLDMRHCIFKGNAASRGGAIDDDIHLVVKQRSVAIVRGAGVTFSNNRADGDGGAIQGTSMSVEISRGFFIDNKSGGSGGAVALRNFGQAHSVFANVLFARNSAAKPGAAFAGDDADFINSTIDSNTGIGVYGAFPDGITLAQPIRLLNTIVSRNTLGNCAAVGNADTFVNLGHNLQFPGNGCGLSIGVADPLLDSMYIPVPKSPAIDRGDNGVCAAPPIFRRDIYGLRRPQGASCTIGAAEGDIEQLQDRYRRRHCRALTAAQPAGCAQNLLDQLLEFGRQGAKRP